MNRKQVLHTLLLAVISGFLGGALSVWFLMPQSVLAQDEPPKVIEAQEFRVVDADGELRARLVSDYATRFQMFGENGQVNVQLQTNGIRGTRLSLKDTGEQRVELVVNDQGPFLSLWDTESGLRVLLGLTGEGSPELRLVDQKNRIRAVLGTTRLTHPDTGSTEIRAPSSLVLFDEDGNVVWSAP